MSASVAVALEPPAPMDSGIPPAPVASPGADGSFRAGLLANLPSLRAFAFTLCWNRSDADDLVQSTLLRALSRPHLFQPGTNLRAWTMTIMRNEFYTALRRRRLEIEDVDGVIAGAISVPAPQAAGLVMDDFALALGRLPAEQREALVLVGADGQSYEEAARICGVAVGTVKSRVHRARQTLSAELDLKSRSDLDLNA